MRSRIEICVGMLFLSFAGCSNTNTSSPPNDAGSQTPTLPIVEKAPWVTFKSSEGKFVVSFPIEPVEKESTTPAGFTKRQVRAILHNGQLVYSVQYAIGPPPEDVRQMHTQAQAGMIQAQRGTLLKEDEIRLGDWYGRAFSFSFESNNQPGLLHTRIYSVEDRVFILMVGGSPEYTGESDAERFFKSFSLLEK